MISPYCERYIVQNRAMEEDLVRYHAIGTERVSVTGWPQTDTYARQRGRAELEELLGAYGLDPALPLVVVMGNTPTNTPYEGRFVARLVDWWGAEAHGRLSLLFRPHPRDRRWRREHPRPTSR